MSYETPFGFKCGDCDGYFDFEEYDQEVGLCKECATPDSEPMDWGTGKMQDEPFDYNG